MNSAPFHSAIAEAAAIDRKVFVWRQAARRLKGRFRWRVLAMITDAKKTAARLRASRNGGVNES